MSMLLTLGKEEIIELLKEKYGKDVHIELYIDYNDEGVEGNDQIIAEINIEEEKKQEKTITNPLCKICEKEMIDNHYVDPVKGRVFGYTCLNCGKSTWDK